jgi:molecular chaperone GrpE
MSDDQTEEINNTDQLQKDLTEAVLQAEANLDGWKRTAADFENYRRRKEEESKELIQFAREVTVAKLLPALDSLEQALKHMPKEENEEARSRNAEFFARYQNWQNGANGIVMQLDKTLEDLGVKKIESVGKKFDPNFHEAVREVESEADDGIVVEELMTGFELNGKVIRPSQVVISKKK